MDKLSKEVEHLKELSKLNVAKNCVDLQRHGITTSNYYSVSYDIEYIQNTPIEVYCDFDKNTTEIKHDMEDIRNIQPCEDTKCCLDLNITYGQSEDTRQIKTLISQSKECYQRIEFDCKNDTMKLEHLSTVKWYDSRGMNRYSFSDQKNGLGLP